MTSLLVLEVIVNDIDYWSIMNDVFQEYVNDNFEDKPY